MAESVVRWIGGGDHGHRCGYCKNPHGSHSEGLWAYSLTPLHYQLLIDRGWRRSGQYCYRPCYSSSCCQLYTVRCLASSFILTKSMRNTLKQVYNYLVFDKHPSNIAAIKFKESKFPMQPIQENGVWVVNPWISSLDGQLERLLCAADSEWYNTAHSISVLLVRSWPPSEFFKATYREEHLVYMAYQCSVHGDSPSKVTSEQFAGFLVETPFSDEQTGQTNSLSFGAYHLQFRINGRLIAVSVIDILPHCVSSVYCFYDPAFTFLKMGTFTALYEVALARALQCGVAGGNFQNLKYYYMGFYINNCQKMKYKGQYKPAELLCPESMKWVPIDPAVTSINAANDKYLRLNPDENAVDDDGENATRIASRLLRSAKKVAGPSPAAARMLGMTCTQELKFV